MFNKKHVLQDKLPGAGGWKSNNINPAANWPYPSGSSPKMDPSFDKLELVVEAFDKLPESAKMIASLDEDFMKALTDAKNYMERMRNW